ncbi:MAG: hypothetical protein A2Y33_00960 [Spirochaetes bacterium GWF1_51_8]|nr:MAG: hypothetical protein A2Y33_00960 [Spirochaetes bacterium GWF1_51_8]
MGGNPAEVKAMITGLLGVDVAGIDDSSVLTELGINKLILVELGAQIEEKYRLDCPPEIAVGFITVADILEFVK